MGVEQVSFFACLCVLAKTFRFGVLNGPQRSKRSEPDESLNEGFGEFGKPMGGLSRACDLVSLTAEAIGQPSPASE